MNLKPQSYSEICMLNYPRDLVLFCPKGTTNPQISYTLPQLDKMRITVGICLFGSNLNYNALNVTSNTFALNMSTTSNQSIEINVGAPLIYTETITLYFTLTHNSPFMQVRLYNAGGGTYGKLIIVHLEAI